MFKFPHERDAYVCLKKNASEKTEKIGLCCGLKK